MLLSNLERSTKLDSSIDDRPHRDAPAVLQRTRTDLKDATCSDLIAQLSKCRPDAEAIVMDGSFLPDHDGTPSEPHLRSIRIAEPKSKEFEWHEQDPSRASRVVIDAMVDAPDI